MVLPLSKSYQLTSLSQESSLNFFFIYKKPLQDESSPNIVALVISFAVPTVFIAHFPRSLAKILAITQTMTSSVLLEILLNN